MWLEAKQVNWFGARKRIKHKKELQLRYNTCVRHSFSLLFGFYFMWGWRLKWRQQREAKQMLEKKTKTQIYREYRNMYKSENFLNGHTHTHTHLYARRVEAAQSAKSSTLLTRHTTGIIKRALAAHEDQNHSRGYDQWPQGHNANQIYTGGQTTANVGQAVNSSAA